MKLLIAGSRSIPSFEFAPYVPEGVELIITGGADGVDKLAEGFARERGIPTLTVRLDYEKFGRASPLRRNEEMVDMADAVLVIWDGVSRGSRYTVRCAEKKGKRLTVVTV